MYVNEGECECECVSVYKMAVYTQINPLNLSMLISVMPFACS